MHPNLTWSPRETALIEQLQERLASSSKHVFSLTDILSLIAQLRADLGAAFVLGADLIGRCEAVGVAGAASQGR